MNKIIDFLNNDNESFIITNEYDKTLIHLLSDYCGFTYEILGNSNIRIVKYNKTAKFQISNDPIIGSIYIGDNIYLFKNDDQADNNSLYNFMSNFKNKISDEMYHFITMLNSINALDILYTSKHAIKSIEKYSNMKVKKICNFYLTYAEIDNKLLIVGLINMISKLYFIVNMYACSNVNSLKISLKYKSNKCTPTCKNSTNPFCTNDHGKKNYLYCYNQINHLHTHGFYDFIVNRYTCQDVCCQGYHIFKMSSPNNYEIKKSI
jgi:hypothetical protein